MKINNLLLEEYGLEMKIKRNSLEQFDIYAGDISYYPIVVSYLGYNTWCEVTISANKQQLTDHFRYLKRKLEQINYVKGVKMIDSHLYLKVGQGTFAHKKITLALHQAIEEIITYFQDQSILPGDFLTGEYDFSIALYRTGQSYLYLTKESKKIIEEKLDQKKALNPQKESKVLRGTIGATIGAFLGASILAALSFYTPFYTSYSVIVFLFSYVGYKIFGRKIGFLGNIIPFIVSTPFIYLAVFIDYSSWYYDVWQLSSLDFSIIKEITTKMMTAMQESPIYKQNYAWSVTSAIKDMVSHGLMFLLIFIFPFQFFKKRETSITRIH